MANKNRDSLLQEKQRSVYNDVNLWAKANDILNPGDEIRVEIKLIPLQRTKSENTVLTQLDWSKIVAVSWNNSQLQLLRLLMENSNAPTKFSKLFPPDRTGMVDENSLNTKFRAANIPFRLKEHESSPMHSHGDRLFHIRKAKV